MLLRSPAMMFLDKEVFDVMSSMDAVCLGMRGHDTCTVLGWMLKGVGG